MLSVPHCLALHKYQLSGPPVLKSQKQEPDMLVIDQIVAFTNSYPIGVPSYETELSAITCIKVKPFEQRLSCSFIALVEPERILFGAVSKHMGYIQECLAANTGYHTMHFHLKFRKFSSFYIFICRVKCFAVARARTRIYVLFRNI